VAGSGGEEEVKAIPEEVEGGHVKVERGCDAGEVVEMLDGVHTEATEGVRGYVSMVEGVNEFVQNTNVNKPVCEVEVEIAPHRNCNGPAYHASDITPR